MAPSVTLLGRQESKGESMTSRDPTNFLEAFLTSWRERLLTPVLLSPLSSLWVGPT